MLKKKMLVTAITVAAALVLGISGTPKQVQAATGDTEVLTKGKKKQYSWMEKVQRKKSSIM